MTDDHKLRVALGTLLQFAKEPDLAACTTYLGFMRRADAIKHAEAVMAETRPPRVGGPEGGDSR